MAFIKIKDKYNLEAAIINTDMIWRIEKEKEGNRYIVFLSSGKYYYDDYNEIKKIFDVIGESLD